MKKCFTTFAATLAAVSLFAVSACCDDDLPPDSAGIYVRTFNKEKFSVENVDDILSNINVAVRNDSISTKPIVVRNVGKWGEINIFFTTEAGYRDWIQIAESDFQDVLEGDSPYYIVLNDVEGDCYDSRYETKELHFAKSERRVCDIYLKRIED